ncbi:EamA family transporter [Lichenihabitans sp. PAMC28606]|uniref:aromatic amino acid exporter YddG n=1 Tax=Lichenihabitans sp. PAMC28606 TaxID=2880932 RepID=UPI001D0B5C76|nr:EamA family transporter [Lichenihabitans sp. PAMC28606]UDL96657.1 EamA family transporter [Lichenihabitans sp. PAMC28606]
MAQIARATLVGSVAILLWSSLALLTTASGRIPPFELAAMTFAIGGAAGLVLAAARGRLRALRQPLRVWAVGVGGLFGYHALYFAALRLAPPAQAGLIAYLWPLLIVLLSATLPGERLRPKHWLGALLGFGGVALLILGQEGGFRPDPHFMLGYGFALLCALVWSVYSVASRRLKAVPTEAVAGFCIATAALALLCHVTVETTVWPDTSAQAFALVGLGLGPVGLAFYVWDHGVKHGDIRLLGVASYAAPVLSTLLLVGAGYAHPTLALWIACALIVAGALLAAWRGPSARVTPLSSAR